MNIAPTQGSGKGCGLRVRKKKKITNAHGTEMAAEYGFPERLDIRDPSVEGDDDGQTPEEEDEDGDDNQSPDGDGQDRVVEIVEGCPGSNVYEAGDVEEKIDDGTEHGLFCLSVEETIPSECCATTEGSKEVVSAEHRSGSNYQESEGKVLSNVGLTIDQRPVLAKLHEVAKTETKDGTVNDGKEDLNW